MGEYHIENVLKDEKNRFILTMDCEGSNFDKNLENNVMNLKRLLKLTKEFNIFTILFITPLFGDMLYRMDLVKELKRDYKVIFGLHIHPDNLPLEIQNVCSFIRGGEEEVSTYSLPEQMLIIKESIEYLRKRDVFPLQIFRGGYFSMNDDTAKALLEVSDIRWESHNVYRQQYKVTHPALKALPVYAFDKDGELRLEYFTREKLIEMVKEVMVQNSRMVGITHSYLLDDNDIHYKRDGIEGSIYSRLEEILKVIKGHRYLS